jgi:hypothetical protein
MNLENQYTPDFQTTNFDVTKTGVNPVGDNKQSFGAWDVMKFASPMYNLVKGFQSPEKAVPNYNPYNDRIRSLMANRRFNVEPMLNQNLTAQAVANRNINNTARSRGEQMGNYGAAQNYRMMGDASAYTQQNNTNNQYLAEQAQMDYGVGRDISMMDQATQVANAQNRGTTNQFLTQSMQDFTNLGQTQEYMGNQKEMDMYKTGIWKDMYGTNIGRWMENINRLISELQAGDKAQGGGVVGSYPFYNFIK